MWRYWLHCNQQEKKVKEGTLDKINALISTQIDLLREFLLFLHLELASQKDTCKTCTSAFEEKIDSV